MMCSKKKKYYPDRKPQSASLAASVVGVVGHDRRITALPPSTFLPVVEGCLVCQNGFLSAILGARAETPKREDVFYFIL